MSLTLHGQYTRQHESCNAGEGRGLVRWICRACAYPPARRTLSEICDKPGQPRKLMETRSQEERKTYKVCHHWMANKSFYRALPCAGNSRLRTRATKALEELEALPSHQRVPADQLASEIITSCRRDTDEQASRLATGVGGGQTWSFSLAMVCCCSVEWLPA